jgi:hypothetical protein
MENSTKFIGMRAGNFSIALFIMMLCVSISTMAQGDGARFYWKGLMGTNAIPVITNSMSGMQTHWIFPIMLFLEQISQPPRALWVMPRCFLLANALPWYPCFFPWAEFPARFHWME